MPNTSRWIHCAECRRNRLHTAHGLCKQCYRRQWYEDHPGYNRQWRKDHPGYNYQWYEDHPGYNHQWGKDNRERKAELNRRWRENNRESKAEYDRQWREDHQEYYSEYKREWAKANPEKRRESGRRRRAREVNAAIGPVDEQKIYELYNYTCIYCGATEDLTLDHIVALANDGAHCEDNLIVACRSCNSSKWTRPLLEWLRTQPQANAWLY